MNARDLSGGALFFALAAAAGFVLGMAIGRGTREALPSATSTSFSGGVLTVRVNAYQAIGGGFSSLLGN